MEFSPDWKLLAIYGRDCKIRVFHFSSGRLIKTIDESISAVIQAQGAEEPNEIVHVENETDFEAKIQAFKDVIK